VVLPAAPTRRAWVRLNRATDADQTSRGGFSRREAMMADTASELRRRAEALRYLDLAAAPHRAAAKASALRRLAAVLEATAARRAIARAKRDHIRHRREADR
jgi:hypothetical protein